MEIFKFLTWGCWIVNQPFLFERRILGCVHVNDEEEISKGYLDEQDNEKEYFNIPNSLSNESNEVSSILEQPHPVKHFNPQKPCCQASNCSNGDRIEC